jgi:hypothetical protein
MVGAVGIEPSPAHGYPIESTCHLDSIGVHNRGYFLNCRTMPITNNMPINLERCSSIGVSQLALDDLWRSTRVQQQRRMRVPESMEPAPWDSERVEPRQLTVGHLVQLQVDE